MSYHEDQYVELNEDEDFRLDAHVDADGQQRFALIGYLVRRRPDGVYRTPLIPEMFYGVNGEQLDTWSQYLTTGDHTILRRDSGNPHVPDSDLHWARVSTTPYPQTRPATPSRPTSTTVTYEIPVVPILVLIAIPLGLVLLWKVAGKALK